MVFVTSYSIVNNTSRTGIILLVVVRDKKVDDVMLLQMHVTHLELSLSSGRNGYNSLYADKLFDVVAVLNSRLTRIGSDRLPLPFMVECNISYDNGGHIESISNSTCRMASCVNPLDVTIVNVGWRNVFYDYRKNETTTGLPLHCLFFVKLAHNIRDNLTEFNKKYFQKTFNERKVDRNAMICMHDHLKRGRINVTLDDVHLEDGRPLSDLCKLVRITLSGDSRSTEFRLLKADGPLRFSDVLTCYLSCRAFNVDAGTRSTFDCMGADGLVSETGTLPIFCRSIDYRVCAIFHGVSPAEIPAISILHRGLLLHSVKEEESCRLPRQLAHHRNLLSGHRSQMSHRTINETWRLAVFTVNSLLGERTYGKRESPPSSSASSHDSNSTRIKCIYICELSSSLRQFCFPKTFVGTSDCTSHALSQSPFVLDLIGVVSRLNTRHEIVKLETNHKISHTVNVVHAVDPVWLPEAKRRCTLYVSNYAYYARVSNWTGGLINIATAVDRTYGFEKDSTHGQNTIIDLDMHEFYPSIIKTISRDDRYREILCLLSSWRDKLCGGDASKFMKSMMVSLFGSLKHTDYIMYLSVIDVSNRCMSDCIDFFDSRGDVVLLVMKDGLLVRLHSGGDDTGFHTSDIASAATDHVTQRLVKTTLSDFNVDGPLPFIKLQLRGVYDRLLLLNTNTYVLVDSLSGNTKTKGIYCSNQSGLTKKLLDIVVSFMGRGELSDTLRLRTIETLKHCMKSAKGDEMENGYENHRVSPWLELTFIETVSTDEHLSCISHLPNLVYAHSICTPPSAYADSKLMTPCGQKRTSKGIRQMTLFDQIHRRYALYDWSPMTMTYTNTKLLEQLRSVMMTSFNVTAEKFIVNKVDQDCRQGLLPIVPNTRVYDTESLIASTCSHTENLLDAVLNFSPRAFALTRAMTTGISTKQYHVVDHDDKNNHDDNDDDDGCYDEYDDEEYDEEDEEVEESGFRKMETLLFKAGLKMKWS